MSIFANYEECTIDFNLVITANQDSGSFPISINEQEEIISRGVVVIPPINVQGKRYIRGITIRTTNSFNDVDVIATLQKVPAGQLPEPHIYPTSVAVNYSTPIIQHYQRVITSWVYSVNCIREDYHSQVTYSTTPQASTQVIKYDDIITLNQNEYIAIVFSNWLPLKSGNMTEGIYNKYTSFTGTVKYYVTVPH